MSKSEGSGVEKSFAAALDAARKTPASGDAWDHLEELADELQRPDEVSVVYREVLGGSGVSGRDWDALAQRAVQFTEEWFGDTPDSVVSLLDQILERVPDNDWAFERLTVVLTGAERWEDLLGAYDRTLEGTKDKSRRKQLLDDAAQVAKDFLGAPLRAVEYLAKQLELEPVNEQLAGSIERLLEKNERWDELIAHWHARLEVLEGEPARAVRVQIAQAYVDQLGEPARALEELRALMQDSPGHAAGSRQLERLLALDGAPREVREGALDLLRTGYEATKSAEHLVGALETALGFADPATRISLHREAGERLAILGRDADAMEHYAALLRESPADSDARKQLRELAARADRQDVRAGALVAAGDATTDAAQRVALLVEAAKLYRDVLKDADAAIDLYSRVLDDDETEAHVAVSVAHELEELFTAAGRPADRLKILERLAELERAPLVRRSILGEAARLAEEQGDPDRALAQWRRRLELSEDDSDALDAIVELLERTERWEELRTALGQRAERRAGQHRRGDLIRLATVSAQQLDDADAAIRTWQQVAQEFGASNEVITRLDELMAGTERWGDLAELLEANVGGVRTRAAKLLSRLGDVHRLFLGNNEDAAHHYARALRNDPAADVARAGLRELLAVDEVASDAAAALAASMEETGDWKGLVDLVDVRIAGTSDPARKARLLIEAASLQEQHGQDAAAALELTARALPIRPDDVHVEEELLRLAEATGSWERAAGALAEAAEATGPGRARQLRETEARLALAHDDAARATDALLTATALEPGSADLWRQVVEAGARAGRWADAARGLIRHAVQSGGVDEVLATRLESAAGEGDAWVAMAEAFRDAVTGLEAGPEVRRSLATTIVRWLRGPAQDLESALVIAEWAVSGLPRDDRMLALLADVERDIRPDTRIETLLRLDGVRDADLDPLFDAVRIAEGERARELWERLWSKSSRMWLAGIAAQGKTTGEAGAMAALEALGPIYDEAGEDTAAIDLRLAAIQLPVPPRELLRLRREAATRLADRGDNPRAIEQLREIVALNPEDREALAKLGDLCRREQRLLELVSVRNQELALTEDIDRRIDLRLEIASLVAELEQGDGRVSALMANLDEVPGHEGSVARLTELLEQRGRHAELADTLTEQARRIEDQGRAARLWEKVAAIAESPLRDLDRAIQAYGEAVALSPTPAVLDHLARIHVQREEYEAASGWLQKRLEGAEARDEVSVRLRLARCQLRAQQEDAAVENLEAAFAETPRNGEVRKLLLRMYRERQSWRPLAAALNTAAENVKDEGAVVAYAREAAEVWGDRLGSPEGAVGVLERALQYAPEDRPLRRALATGLRAQGRLDEAAAMLRELIATYGRRRSPERAQVHLELARVAAQREDMPEALEQLETASKMDASSVAILHTLADLARKAGELDRAERAYRTLLMNVKRAQGPVEIGASEVLLELGRIAADRDDPEKANELIESALEAVTQNDDEAPRLQARLQEIGDVTLLKRVLESRLERVEQPKRRAAVLSQIADLREQDGDEEAALEARLEALEADPASPPLHDAAKELSARLGKPGAYEDRLETLLEGARRGTDVQARCELLLRLAQMKEADGDYDGAATLLAQAEETGVREIDVWRAMSRVAGEREDDDTQRRVLEKLVALGEDQKETRVDASYRLAEVQLSSRETVAEGVDTLRRALQDEPRWERVARLLRRASDAHTDAPEILDLYEKAARRSEDPELTLHFLERRAAQAEVTPEQVREAVEQARTLGHEDREEALLMRAIDVAEGLLDGRAQVSWALLGLAARRFATDDMAGAVKWLIEASEVSDLGPILELGRKIASTITESGGDLTLAAKLYEHLVDLDRSALDVWRPLAGIYRELGDFGRLERLVEETLDSLEDASARNALRLELADALLRTEGRQDDAVQILEAVLEEEPESLRGQELLADHLQATGRTDELRELLEGQLDKAVMRRDGEAASALARRLADALDDDDALDVLRKALTVSGDDRELLRTVVDRLPADHDVGERAQLLERLAQAADDDEVVAVALRAADAHAEGGDASGASRVLEVAYRRMPGSTELRERLEAVYRDRGDHAGLVRIMLDAAMEETDQARQAQLLIGAARVQRDDLGDAVAAADTLGRALADRSDDVELVMELASTLAVAGQPGEAIDKLGELLESLEEDSAYRMDVLVRRSDARQAVGDEGGALEDLWAAFEISPEAVADAVDLRLADAQRAAAEARDSDGERELVMRRVDVAQQVGNTDAIRTLLAEWTDRQRKDVEALRMLRDLETDAQDWEPLIKVCSRLVALEEGPDQITAALRLSYACEQVGRPEDARRGLEHARRKQPDNPDLRRELRNIYERVGAQAELGALLLEEAASNPDPERKVEALMAAGQMLATGGSWAEAADAFAQAFEVRPGDASIAASLANARIATGEPDVAQQILDDAIAACKGRRSPELAILQQIQSRVSAAQGDGSAQMDWLAQAFSCDPKNSAIALELAQLAEDYEEYDTAIRALRSLAMMKEDSPMPMAENYARQGRVSLRKGDRQRAVLWGRKAKQEDPDNPLVAELLAQLDG